MDNGMKFVLEQFDVCCRKWWIKRHM